MNQIGALLIASLIFSPGARAASNSCAFVPRAQAKLMLGNLPSEVIGYSDCSASQPGVRSLMMAQFKSLDDEALETFVSKYARIAVPDARRSYVVKQMKEADGRRQAVIETVRPGGSQPVWHYVFTSRAKNGDVVLYIHSSSAKESRDLRASLQAVRHELIGKG